MFRWISEVKRHCASITQSRGAPGVNLAMVLLVCIYVETDPNYLILGEKAPEVTNGFMNEAEGLFSKITDPKVQEMLLKQIRALV